MSATRDLLHHYQHVISEFRLITGSKGVFDVVVDGQTIFSKDAVGRHANEGEILELFTQFVGSEVPRYER